jgi:hypothetical protein
LCVSALREDMTIADKQSSIPVLPPLPSTRSTRQRNMILNLYIRQRRRVISWKLKGETKLRSGQSRIWKKRTSCRSVVQEAESFELELVVFELGNLLLRFLSGILFPLLDILRLSVHRQRQSILPYPL